MSHQHLEHNEQAALVTYCQVMRYPIVAIPNGAHLANSFRSWSYLQAEGATKGFPDLFIPKPRQGYHGLFIEMKISRNRLSPDQITWQNYLNEQGYLAVACWGFDQAKQIIDQYFTQE